jgi:hypothetical protein
VGAQDKLNYPIPEGSAAINYYVGESNENRILFLI